MLTTRKVGGEDSVWSFVRIKYGPNATDTVSGTLIYPDDFSFSEAGVASIVFARKPETQINAADWAALEEAGCVFLPGARACEFKADIWTFGEVETGVLWHYQTCTATSAANSNVIRFNPLANGTTNPHVNFPNYGRNLAFPVRLAQDVK